MQDFRVAGFFPSSILIPTDHPPLPNVVLSNDLHILTMACVCEINICSICLVHTIFILSQAKIWERHPYCIFHILFQNNLRNLIHMFLKFEKFEKLDVHVANLVLTTSNFN